MVIVGQNKHAWKLSLVLLYDNVYTVDFLTIWKKHGIEMLRKHFALFKCKKEEKTNF